MWRSGLPKCLILIELEDIMYILASDEKTTTVMVYSPNKLIHGDLVTKINTRVSLLPRMSMPGYLHFLNTEVLFFGGSSPKTLAYEEYFFPTERIIGFHLAPPSSEPLDYDPNDPQEADRTLVDMNMILGAFMLKGKIRISTHADFVANLEAAHMTWLSVYDAEIVNPFLPQMAAIQVPMLLAKPTQVSFGL
jgi:hypothetical protein